MMVQKMCFCSRKEWMQTVYANWQMLFYRNAEAAVQSLVKIWMAAINMQRWKRLTVC